MFTLNSSVKSGLFSVTMAMNLTTATFRNSLPTMVFNFTFHAPKHHNKMVSLNGWSTPSIILSGPSIFRPTFHPHIGLRLSIWLSTYKISDPPQLLPMKSLILTYSAKPYIIAFYARLAAYVTPTYTLTKNFNHVPHPPFIWDKPQIIVDIVALN